MGETDVLRHYGSHVATDITAVGLVAILCGGIVAMRARRDYALVSFLLVTLLIPQGQTLNVLGINFMLFRIMILVVWLRILLRSEHLAFQMELGDRLFGAWVLASVISGCVLWANMGAFINRLGFAYDVAGSYYAFRILCRDRQDVAFCVRTLVFVSVVVSVFMVVEQMTGHNAFAALGGVPELNRVRDGRIRSQGPFAHALLAGTFGAVVFPMCSYIWYEKGPSSRILAVTGSLACIVMVATSASSGPLCALGAGIGAMCFWRFRHSVPRLCRILVVAVVVLHLVMKAPVWALLGRFTLISGSTGYHRYILVDNFIRRFDEWWLCGTKSTDHWGVDMWDITNAYVEQGVNGGVVTFSLFLGLLWANARALGNGLRRESQSLHYKKGVWSIGCSFFSYLIAFLGVTLWGPARLVLYLLFAMILAVAKKECNSCYETGRESGSKIPTVKKGTEAGVLEVASSQLGNVCNARIV